MNWTTLSSSLNVFINIGVIYENMQDHYRLEYDKNLES